MKHILTTVVMLTLIIGCGAREKNVKPIIEKKPQSQVKKSAHTVPQSKLPPAPKKKIKLKEVDDKNYTDKYMYPEDTAAAKKDPVKAESAPSKAASVSGMSREECITMITQVKFDKYTTMFGSEEASIKRCAMIKAMNK